MEKKVLVTGALGAVGTSAVAALLEEGFTPVALVRPRRDVARCIRARWGRDIPHVAGDVTKPLCGADSSSELRRGAFSAVLHMAGRTQYHENLRADTFNVNVEGTRNVMALAALLEIPRFVFVSTAYVAGARPYLSETERGEERFARNPYEESKIVAEGLVADAWPGEAVILRLSTIAGDSRSGFVADIGGYAAFTRSLWAYRGHMARYGSSPFYVGINPAGTLNLVPIDWAARLISSAAGAPGLSGTFHLTHPEPVSLGFLFKETFRKGLRLPLTCDRREAERTALWGDSTWRKVQEAISALVEYFGPYVWRDSTFAHERVRSIPGYAPPPTVDAEFIGRHVGYLRDHLFSKPRGTLVRAAT